MKEKNLNAMLKGVGFDVFIICTSNESQAIYWQERLETVKGDVIPEGATVLAVDEDWEGGAGNALGTFYAYEKACAKAAAMGIKDIHARLQAGAISIGMYHTAGKGTRLAPLPGAENNNKPGVKLPALLKVGKTMRPMTILESVIRQTGVYASSRKGRLSVFWGDQIFIPSVATEYVPKHHIDILCFLGPLPSREVWERDGLEKYGLIAVNEYGDAAQVEKVTHGQAVEMLKSLGNVKSVGPSLGSFSISNVILDQFLEEFKTELKAKKGKFDTDPHLWMPLSLDETSYVNLMETKGVKRQEAQSHHRRMKKMLKEFIDAGNTNGVTSPLKSKDKNSTSSTATDKLGLFGAVDVGTEKYWWDYGQLRLYHTNVMRLRGTDAESVAMRKFFKISSTGEGEACRLGSTAVGGALNSCVSKCDIMEGSIQSSLLCGVNAKHIDATDAILVNVTASGSIVAPPGSIIYNVAVEGDLKVAEGEVLAGVFDVDGTMCKLKSTTTTDGGKEWKNVVFGNSRSFEANYKTNLDTNVTAVEVASQATHAKLGRENSKNLDATESSSRMFREVALGVGILALVAGIAMMAVAKGKI